MNSDLNIDEIARTLCKSYMFSRQNRAYSAVDAITKIIENQQTEDFFNGYNKFLKEITGSELDDFLNSFLITDKKEVMPNE